MRWFLAACLVAACGDGIEPSPDATVTPDVPLGLVAVRVTKSAPPGGYQVFFQAADSSLVLATHTGADGVATGYMPAGGFVTLVTETKSINGTTHAAYTWADVQAGDQLVLDLPPEAHTTDPLPVWIDFPRVADAHAYSLVSSCGIARLDSMETGSQSVDLAGCRGGAADMLVKVFGDGEQFLFKSNVAIEPNTTVVFEPPFLTVLPSTVHAVNVPSRVKEMYARQALIGGTTMLYVDGGFNLSPLTPTDGAGSAKLFVPLPETGTLLSEVHELGADRVGRAGAFAWGPARDQAWLDFGPALRALTATPVYVSAEHAIRWQEEPTGVLADAVLSRIEWQTMSEGFQWSIIAPRTDDAVARLPMLPLPAFHLGAQNVFATQLANIAIDSGGYARLRPHVLGSWGAGQPWPTSGPSGQVVVESN